MYNAIKSEAVKGHYVRVSRPGLDPGNKYSNQLPGVAIYRAGATGSGDNPPAAGTTVVAQIWRRPSVAPAVAR